MTPLGGLGDGLFAEARSVLEGGETAARRRDDRRRSAANGGEHRGGADEPTEQERLQAVASLLAVHATILGMFPGALASLLETMA